MRLRILFLRITCVLLALTGLIKLLSAGGESRILSDPDPLLPLSNRELMLLAGLMELVVVWFLLSRKPEAARLLIVAALGTEFLLYRIGLWWIHATKPCSCLGNATGWLGISPAVADNTAKAILVFLLVGSYYFLLKQKRSTRTKAEVEQPSSAAVIG